jgi:hypothetical protein
MQPQPQPQQNENSSLVKAGRKDWTDNATLDEIVKYEYQESNKSQFVQVDVELLQKKSFCVFRRLEATMHLHHLFRKN